MSVKHMRKTRKAHEDGKHSSRRASQRKASRLKRFLHAFTLEGVYFSIADTLYWVYLGAFAVAAGASAGMVAAITRLPGALSGLILPLIRNIHYWLKDETRLYRLVILTGFISMLTAIILLLLHPALSILPSIILFLTGQLMASSSTVLVHSMLPRNDSSYLGYRQGLTFLATLIALLTGSAISNILPERVFYPVIFTIILFFKLLDVRETLRLPDVKGVIKHPIRYAFPTGSRLAFLILAFISAMGASIVGSLLPSYRLSILHVPLSLYPLFFFLFIAGVGLASPLWGVYAEAHGLRSLFFTALIMKAFFLLPWAFSTSIPLLFLTEFLSGIANGAIGLAFTLYAIHLTRSDEERVSYRMQLSTTISLAMLTSLAIVWISLHTPLLTILFKPLLSLLPTPHQQAFAFSILIRLLAAPFILILLPNIKPKAARAHLHPRIGSSLREYASLAIRALTRHEGKGLKGSAR